MSLSRWVPVLFIVAAIAPAAWADMRAERRHDAEMKQRAEERETKKREAAAAASRHRTIAAGVAMAGAIALAGVWLLRSRQSKTAAALTLVIAGLTSAASADIRVPGQPYRGPAKRPEKEPPRPPETARSASFEVLVATSGGSGTPQLVIPREAVKGLLADASGPVAPDADRLASAPTTTAPGDQTAAPEADSPDSEAAMPQAHSIIAGLAMAFAVALGGVWFARSRSRTSRRGLTLLISASLCLGVGVTAWANVGPPKTPPPSQPATSTRLETAFTGKVQVKFVSGDGAVQLVLPHSDLLKLVEKENQKR